MDERDLGLVRQVADWCAARWTLVDRDDVEGELLLWLVENEETAADYRRNGDMGKLTKSLKRVATKYAVKESTVAQGGQLWDDAPYTVEQVERVLPFVFEPQGHTTDLVNAVMVDVKTAISWLPDDMKETLTQRFYYHYTFEQIGAKAGISKQAAQKRVEKAIQELRNNLSR